MTKAKAEITEVPTNASSRSVSPVNQFPTSPMAYVDIHCPGKALVVDGGWPEGEDTSESTPSVDRHDDESSASSLKVMFRGKPRRRGFQGEQRARPRSSPTPLSSAGLPLTTPIIPPASDKSVTFKFREMLESEKPGLATLFPVTWQPGMKEYLIISDPDESDSDNNSEQPANEMKDRKSAVKTEKTDPQLGKVVPSNQDNADLVPSNSDTEDELDLKEETNLNEAVKHDRSLKSKLSILTKDIGNLFSGPSHNLREFLRRREGYLPPDQAGRLVRKKVEDHH